MKKQWESQVSHSYGDRVIHNSENLLENDLLKEMSNTHKEADVLKNHWNRY